MFNVLESSMYTISVGGHDSAEDALACLDLMKMKAKDDMKKLKQMAKLEARKAD